MEKCNSRNLEACRMVTPKHSQDYFYLPSALFGSLSSELELEGKSK
jgi:hypothetical protein